MKHYLPFFILLFCLAGCETNLSQETTFSRNRQLQAVIETPAGSAHTYRYHAETNEFVKVQVAGQDKIVKFLPYPVNAGFIPSTLDTSQTGVARPLPVMIISESQPSGTVMEILPLGVLVLEVKGELQYQLIAVPAKPSQRLIIATDFATFSGEYPTVKKILEQWFLHANPGQETKIMGWKDNKFADKLVRKWMK